MVLDVSTLTFASGLVALACGLFLIGIWWQERSARSILCWGIANVAASAGIILLAYDGNIPPPLTRVAAPLILLSSAALTWVAARLFSRACLPPTLAIVGIGLLVALYGLALTTRWAQLVNSAGVVFSAGFFVAAALEFWLARKDEYRGRWPMIFLLGIQALALVLAAVDLATGAIYHSRPGLGLFGSIHFVSILYLVGGTVSLVSMLKERSEAAFKAAALIDPLTGLSNRRAFLEAAQRIFRATEREPMPISVLVFDLDRFKRINDAHGHATGDLVLVTFANMMSRHLRPIDVVGRLGGEEFAAVLPGCDGQAALAIAGRVRSAFQDAAVFLHGQKISATVSIGLVTVLSGTLNEALERADGALYRAKDLGRNRVAAVDDDRPGPAAAKVIRIA